MTYRPLELLVAIAVTGLIVALLVLFVIPSDRWRLVLLVAWILSWVVTILRERRA